MEKEPNFGSESTGQNSDPRKNAGSPIQNNKATVRIPMLLGITLAGGMLIGATFFGGAKSLNNIGRGYTKYREILQLIENNYVDTVNTDELVDYSIEKMLHKLDPHTAYMNPQDAIAARSQLEGGFDGIGVEFNIYKDTVYVVTPISGGPSETAGLLSGDRIIKVDNTPLVGGKIENSMVFKALRGKRGTDVKMTILRKGEKDPKVFTVTRDRIPTYSVDAAYMVDSKTGYIKVNRFSETTYDEFKAALASLRAQGMTQLLMDLRNNPGGYMDRATSLADEFISGNKLLVYTDGKDNRYDRQTHARIAGQFEEGPLVVLVDEGSASASEIVAGALQDHDRALIAGRRSFGKGLVQMPVQLSDGSELRLTISRYYTPSGRSIQKPYVMGQEGDYEKDLELRSKRGEYYIADSIKNDPKLKFKTDGGRVVYGGGGITPDYFIPRDSTWQTPYLIQLYGKNIIREFAMEYANDNRAKLDKMSFADFDRSALINDEQMNRLVKAASAEGIKFNEKEYGRSKNYIRTQIKALVARSVYQKKNKAGQNNEFFKVIGESDDTYQKALKLFDRAGKLESGTFTYNAPERK
ncbi:S41 family peptidase [Spirosoma utsteinense]|uniref:Carboxyl-terminal processing protease n=1 Tax=Spirosoma utsteinense TaxID=2585773 RepID=A0ABR6WB55_9BACT|nr:S41 family peptidase [Spirosoma utsteinense]MBC3788521.1 carboxyl-terminal processing protease [Spirosoma utsteinense]MBC3793165.1 carboxyl-terminal processing protease [Spirosoma utsteinense]